MLTFCAFLLMLLWVGFIAFSALVVNTRRNWRDVGLYIALVVLFVPYLISKMRKKKDYVANAQYKT